MKKSKKRNNPFMVLLKPSTVFNEEKDRSSCSRTLKNLFLSFGVVSFLLFIVMAITISAVDDLISNLKIEKPAFLEFFSLKYAFLVALAFFILFIGIFFIFQFLFFLFSKLFKGNASFKKQVYLSSVFLPSLVFCSLLIFAIFGIFIIANFSPLLNTLTKAFQDPALINNLISKLQYLKNIGNYFLVLQFFVFVYGIILQIKSLKVAHNFSILKAFLSWLIPSAILFSAILFLIPFPNSSVLNLQPNALGTEPQTSFELYDCKSNPECFVEKLENCSLAKALFIEKFNNFNLTISAQIYGVEDSYCKIKFKLIKLEPKIINIEGKWALCKIPLEDLKNYQSYLKEKRIDVCEGPLVEMFKLYKAFGKQ